MFVVQLEGRSTWFVKGTSRLRAQELLDCRAERVGMTRIAKERPPQGDPAARSDQLAELSQTDFLIHPVE
jgi:hypothetical protein